MGPESVENLRIWQEGMDLAVTVYRETRRWPEEERFGLVSQARRAASSIPANIAEGLGRGSRREIVRFARVALGSAYELRTLLKLAERLDFFGDFRSLNQALNRLTRQISAFITYQEAK